MVTPITGPFGPSIDVNTSLQFYQKRWSRQSRPYSLVLPYSLYDVKTARFNDVYGPAPSSWFPAAHLAWLAGYVETGIPTVDNVAYAKLRGKLYQSNADFGVVLGEHRSAREMMLKRSKQMVDLARFLQGGNIKAADELSRTMAPSRNRGKRGRNIRWARRKIAGIPKGIAGLWLEYSWGWGPAYEDICKALEVLTDPVMDKYVRSTHEQTFSLLERDLKWSETYTLGSGYRSGTERRTYDFTYRCASGCAFAVTNRNVLLANRLGVLNLPKLVYSVTAFSFLVDKYVNLGQMIGSLTDLYGLSISRSWTSRSLIGMVNDSRDFVDMTAPLPGGQLIGRSKNYRLTRTFLKTRKTGLIGPTLTTREASVGSHGEAASYIALLVQILSGRK